MAKTYLTQAIVLKRMNYGEADRIVTLYSADRGKVVCLAKGARKLTSKKKSSLEPATEARFFMVARNGLDLVTQSELVDSHQTARINLTRMTQLYQLLEIVDLMTVEDQENEDVYSLLQSSLSLLDEPGSKKSQLLLNLHQMMTALGFGTQTPLSEHGLKLYIEEIAERQLRAKTFLTLV